MLAKIDPKSIDTKIFSQIDEEWMLITAGTTECCNTMTASWGALGTLWGKSMATVYIRPQRYTLEFVERSDYFTLSFFGRGHRQELALCGSKSGREIDKVKACGFTVSAGAGGAPYFQEADLVLVCKKAYWQDLDPTHFLDGGIDGTFYGEKDYHRMYLGEVVEAYRKG